MSDPLDTWVEKTCPRLAEAIQTHVEELAPELDEAWQESLVRCILTSVRQSWPSGKVEHDL
jgi:hypothetical protein